MQLKQWSIRKLGFCQASILKINIHIFVLYHLFKNVAVFSYLCFHLLCIRMVNNLFLWVRVPEACRVCGSVYQCKHPVILLFVIAAFCASSREYINQFIKHACNYDDCISCDLMPLSIRVWNCRSCTRNDTNVQTYQRFVTWKCICHILHTHTHTHIHTKSFFLI